MKALIEYMSAFDDDDASAGVWQALLEDSVTDYNGNHGTNFDPFDAFMAYVSTIGIAHDV